MQDGSGAYRTTGSTCLHPLSQLLGIPLDQVTAGGRPGRGWGVSAGTLPEPEREGSRGKRGGGCYLPPVPAPKQISLLQTRQVEFCLFELMFFSCKYVYTLHSRFE